MIADKNKRCSIGFQSISCHPGAFVFASEAFGTRPWRGFAFTSCSQTLPAAAARNSFVLASKAFGDIVRDAIYFSMCFFRGHAVLASTASCFARQHSIHEGRFCILANHRIIMANELSRTSRATRRTGYISIPTSSPESSLRIEHTRTLRSVFHR